MLIVYQVTVDCADPERLADFWSAAVGYPKHDYSSQYAEHPEWKGKFALVKRPEGGGPGPATIHFQLAEEHKAGKNRLHLDLFADNVPNEVDRLRELGATFVEGKRDFDQEWTVMADPEGNEFCVGWLPGTGS